MEIPLYQIDAFTRRPLAGNPAAVCPLPRWLDDALLQAIAAENNLSETAFVVPEGDGWRLRWFTPTLEVALCGHATLAAAYALRQRGAEGALRFYTRSGLLTVTADGDRQTMDLPAQPPSQITPPEGLVETLGVAPQAFFQIRETHGARYFMALYPSAADVAALRPDTAAMGALNANIIVTARGPEGGDADFVSRFFAPASGIAEDPVTGSAHCSLAPYWAGVLGQSTLFARQLSRRGGEIWCTVRGDRVLISGHCAPYLEGLVQIPV